MHFAGSIVVPESVEKPLDYYANNTLASHALISAAVAAGIKHILFSSTAAVYGAPEKVPVAEEDPKEPINPYGASKLMTEWMLRDASAAMPFNYGALRYFNVAGADPQQRAGQQGKGSTHLIKVAVEAAVGLRDHVAVYGTDYDTPDGTCIRDYIHVSDLAAAHVAALERLIDHPEENLVVNCGYGRGLSVLEVLDAVDRANGAPIDRRMEGRRAGDPPALVSANARILETLDWRPQYNDIDRIVGDALAWERKLKDRAG
jgi:UDP-glucose 4-epimerase